MTSYGVVVGRFQVASLHNGHLELLKAVDARHSRVIVFIGVSPLRGTKYNPLDFENRRSMIHYQFPHFIILPIQDQASDEVWSRNLDAKIREVINPNSQVTLYGGRDCFKKHYTGSYPVMELAINGAKDLSGENVRKEIANKVIESEEFRAGIIYGIMNRYPHVVSTVDIAVYHKNVDDYELLLGRKKGETGWRFIGGHAEVGTNSIEIDARNEVMEESCLEVGPLEYIGNILVPDWRYTKEEDKIKTTMYAAEALTLGASAGDDIHEVGWFKLEKLDFVNFVPEHRALFAMTEVFFNQKRKRHESAKTELVASN